MRENLKYLIQLMKKDIKLQTESMNKAELANLDELAAKYEGSIEATETYIKVLKDILKGVI